METRKVVGWALMSPIILTIVGLLGYMFYLAPWCMAGVALAYVLFVVGIVLAS